MPPLESYDVYDDALLWAAFENEPDAYGQFRVESSPSQIKVRWLDTYRIVLDAQGNEIALDAMAVVRQDIAVGSRMVHSTLAEYLGTGSGLPDAAVFIVKTFNKTPDIKNRYYFREVGLMRLRAEASES